MNADALAGRLVLRTGVRQPNVERLGLRGAERLAQGRPARAVPALLGALFTLCGSEHRLTAQRALDAARLPRGAALAPLPDGQARALQARTAREQVRRLLVDAPPALGLPPAPPTQLQRCPFWHAATPEAALAALPAWLEAEVLAMPLAGWLAGWEADGAVWLRAWAARARTPVARLLRRLWPWGEPLRPAWRPLRLDAHDGSALTLADRLAAGQPLQDGDAVPFATGPWCRAREHALGAGDNAWMMFASRLTDLARLAAPDAPGLGAAWLAAGAVGAGDTTGLAWTETARGLLVHRIALDGTDRVAQCRVVSPTDWNFDAQGPAAAALRAFEPPPQEADAVAALALALDPCMAWSLQPQPAGAAQPLGAAHA